MTKPKVCVYCGSSERADPSFARDAERLGRLLAENGYDMVFGGGAIGLMGAVARGIHAGEGQVTGVLPRLLNRPEIAYAACDHLIETETMRERKAEMDRLADAFVALPGGFGTLEELIEAITLKQLGYHERPILILNTGDFYAGLMSFVDSMVEAQFVRAAHRDLYAVVETPEGVIAGLSDYRPAARVSKFGGNA